ncbi:MAG TPA: GMP synthase (glutamine-hydrolyzing), partial [Dehalococcoidia bacterium]|nr:GMP synthase (glutamine-hydrolyzing) [Dehalococcoidia bacterium]
MPEDSNLTTNRRIAASDDLEVSAYLEIAQELSGQRLDQSEPIEAHQETLLVLDFGSQYSRLIARRIREAHVYCEIIPHDAPWETVADLNPKGIILSGGPASVYEDDAPLAPAWVFESGLPVLGICYGMQAMVHQLGGKVNAGSKREFGHAVLHQNATDFPLFDGLPASM